MNNLYNLKLSKKLSADNSNAVAESRRSRACCTSRHTRTVGSCKLPSDQCAEKQVQDLNQQLTALKIQLLLFDEFRTAEMEGEEQKEQGSVKSAATEETWRCNS